MFNYVTKDEIELEIISNQTILNFNLLIKIFFYVCVHDFVSIFSSRQYFHRYIIYIFKYDG